MKENIKKFVCSRCGDCCRYWGGMASATDNDLRRWMLGGRKDILQYVELGIVADNGIKFIRGDEWDGSDNRVIANMFISPRTKKEMINCPFLIKETKKRTYKCKINDTKPDICREFPFDDLGGSRTDEGAYIICPEIRKRGAKLRLHRT
ncbi:MAG: YkgJ family cysteine cluster protein [Candidatus Altiarchaeota archaeon]